MRAVNRGAMLTATVDGYLASGASSRPARYLARRRILVLIGAPAYLAIFHLAYVASVVPRWEPLGLTFALRDHGVLLLIYLLAVLPALFLPIAVRRPSDMVLWILYTAAYVPSLLVPHFVLGDSVGLVPFSLVITGAFALLVLMQLLPTVRMPEIVREESAADLLLIAVAVGLLLIVISAFGVVLEIPGLVEVYDVRGLYTGTIRDVGTGPAYAVGFAGNAVNPALIVRGIERRSPVLIGVGLISQFLIYGATGFRSTFLASFLVVLLYFAVRLGRASFGVILIWGLAAIVAGASFAHLVFDWTLPSDLLIRRMLALPGQLVGYYFEFFSTNPTYELSHSVLGFVIDPPYSVGQDRLIAYVYFGHPNASANGNLWADGYANFRLAGVVGMTLVTGLLLRLADGISHGRSLAVAAGTFSIAMFSLTNSSVLTSMLSHGIVAAFLTVILLPYRRPADAANGPGTSSGP